MRPAVPFARHHLFDFFDLQHEYLIRVVDAPVICALLRRGQSPMPRRGQHISQGFAGLGVGDQGLLRQIDGLAHARAS